MEQISYTTAKSIAKLIRLQIFDEDKHTIDAMLCAINRYLRTTDIAITAIKDVYTRNKKLYFIANELFALNTHYRIVDDAFLIRNFTRLVEHTRYTVSQETLKELEKRFAVISKHEYLFNATHVYAVKLL